MAPHVLHLIPHFGYLSESAVVGGHASAAYALAKGQAAAGYRVTIAARIPGQSAVPRDIPGPITLHPLPIRSQVGSMRSGFDFWREAQRACSTMSGAFDVLHVHSGYADYAVIAAALKRRLGPPTVHSLYCRAGFSALGRLPGRSLFVRRALERLDHVVVSSRGIEESLLRIRLNATLMTIVRPPVDTSLFADADARSLRSELGIDESALLVLFVGNLSTTKNLLGVLSAFRLMKSQGSGARLVVTTEYRRSDETVVDEALNQAVRDMDVVRLGLVPDMPRLIATADVVTTVFREGAGPSDYFMVGLEAMAAGKVVVTSPVGAMPEVVIDGSNGFVTDPNDPCAIARAITMVERDSTVRDRVGSAAKHTVRDAFSVSASVSAMEAIYRRIRH